MARLELDGIRKSFGALEVIRGIDLTVEHGDFAVFVGPSGCGKSTLLRMIAGLEGISAGTFRLDGAAMNEVPPDRRGIAMVFQSYALYPHMSVAENIGFSLDLKGVPKAEIAREVGAVAETLQLTPLLDRKPAQLSGGQRQRVAIGRAIVKRPKVILFDEPLSNLDASLRVQMRAELQALHRRTGATIVYVTHDQVEAMTLATRIVVLDAGRVMQAADPITLYKRPDNAFVAQFIGSPKMNLLDGRVVAADPSGVRIAVPGAGWEVGLPVRAGVVAGEPVRLGIRPEAMARAAPGAPGTLPATAILAERLGMETYLAVALADGTPATARLQGDVVVEPGTAVAFAVDASACHLFRADGSALALH